MKSTSSRRLEGRFMHVVYSPRGEIEGAMLQMSADPAQIVLDRDDERSADALLHLQEGQSLTFEAEPAGPSPKGRSEHPVYALRKVVAVDGRKPVEHAVDEGPAYRGRVVRFNYARHGAVNGVVLDGGDFLHLKPEGQARLGLQIGDEVRADGDAQQLADGRGWAVEVRDIDGRSLSKH